MPKLTIPAQDEKPGEIGVTRIAIDFSASAPRFVIYWEKFNGLNGKWESYANVSLNLACIEDLIRALEKLKKLRNLA